MPKQSQEVVVCQGCPFGCVVTATLDDAGRIVHAEGNACERGLAFAHSVIEGGGPVDASSGVPANSAPGDGASRGETMGDPAEGAPKKPARGYRAFRREHARKRAQGE